MGIAAYLSLVVVFAVFAVEGAAVVVAVRMWRQRKHPGASRVGLTVGAVVGGTVAVIAAAAVFATATSLLTAFRAVSGESLDPTQKARILAQGISAAMNYTAFSMLLALPLSIGLLVYAFIRDRRNPGPS